MWRRRGGEVGCENRKDGLVKDSVIGERAAVEAAGFLITLVAFEAVPPGVSEECRAGRVVDAHHLALVPALSGVRKGRVLAE